MRLFHTTIQYSEDSGSEDGYSYTQGEEVCVV